MDLSKYTSNNYESYKLSIPIQHHLPYFREELDGYYSLLTENGDNNYTMINSTTKYIFDLCNGKNNVQVIFEKLQSKFPEIDSKKIKQDLITNLIDLTRLKAIDWEGDNKVMTNPLLNSVEIKISEDSNILLAKESDISLIYNYLVDFFENYNKDESKVSYFWGIDNREFLDLTVIRQCLFSYYKDFFIIKKCGKISGMIIMKPSTETYLHNVSFNLISIDKSVFKVAVDTIINFYKEYPVKKINVLQLDLMKNEKDSKTTWIEEEIKSINFHMNGVVKKLYSEDLDVVSYTFYTK